MRPTLITRPPTRLALALTLVLALTACAGDTATTPQATTARATPSASPTEEPVDVAQEFASNLRAWRTFVSEISGTVRIGELEGEVSGELTVVGADAHTVMVVTFPGLPPQETEEIKAGGLTYKKTDLGYWLRSAPTEVERARRDPVTAALANAEDLEVVGTETHDRKTLHRIESTRPADIAPADLGFTDPTITDFEADVAFLAEDDGTPAAILFDVEWVQGPTDARVPAALGMRIMVEEEEAVTVEAPEDVWVRYQSTELGYQMDHPASWDVTHEPAAGGFRPFDFFIGPVDGQVQVYGYTEEEIAGLLANQWFRHSADVLNERLTSGPELANTISLANGLEAQIFIGESTEPEGTLFFQEAVVFGGDMAWDLDWYSDPGNEVEDQVLLLKFVMSFERYAP